MKLLFFDIKTTRGMKELRSEKKPVLGKSLYLNRSSSYSSLKLRKRVAIERTRFSNAIFDMKLLFFDIKTPRGMKELRSEKVPVLGKSLYLNRSSSYSSFKLRNIFRK